jgi:hypothetical protein
MTERDYLSVGDIARQIATLCGLRKEAKMAIEAAEDYGRIIASNYGGDPVALDNALSNLPLELKSAFLGGYQEMSEKALNARIAEAEAMISRFELAKISGNWQIA